LAVSFQAGGVAKDYLALCRALIDGLGWEVTLFTPVNIKESGEEDVTIPDCIKPPGCYKVEWPRQGNV